MSCGQEPPVSRASPDLWPPFLDAAARLALPSVPRLEASPNLGVSVLFSRFLLVDTVRRQISFRCFWTLARRSAGGNTP